MRSTARWKRLTVDQSRSSRSGSSRVSLQSRDQGVEDVGEGAGDGVAFGKWPRIGLVVEGAVAVELNLAEEVIGWG